MLKGTQRIFFTERESSVLNYGTAAAMITLMLISLALLLMGHQMVIVAIFVTVCSASFYATFVVTFQQTALCTAPLLIGAGVGVLLGVLAICCFEVSFFVLGAIVGCICAIEARS